MQTFFDHLNITGIKEKMCKNKNLPAGILSGARRINMI
jgi:hypothetical protein